MARETTNAGVLGSLGRFNTAMAANAPDLTHLEGPRVRLDKLLTEAEQVAKEQSALIASKQESSKRLRTLLVEAQRVASGLRKLVTEHYGLRSEKLAEFGLQPFRGRTRKAKPAGPETPQTTGTQPPAASPAAPVNPNL
jgi:hypothetical protein